MGQSPETKKGEDIFMSKKTKSIIIAVAVLLVLVLGALLAYNALKPEAQAGGKTVTVVVVHGDGSEKSFTLRTDAENLRAACEEQELIAGEESDYGLYVLTVDGETADESLQQWWCITKGGEEHFYGVDDTAIADGEQYEFTLTTGW